MFSSGVSAIAQADVTRHAKEIPIVRRIGIASIRRSVIVKINDRGPYIRGRIIDLSPHAADVLEMKRIGVVAVVVEPLVY
jgi:rare lipoprotein A